MAGAWLGMGRGLVKAIQIRDMDGCEDGRGMAGVVGCRASNLFQHHSIRFHLRGAVLDRLVMFRALKFVASQAFLPS